MKGAGTAEYATADARDTEAIERATHRPTTPMPTPTPWYHKSYVVFGLGILGAVLLVGLVIAVVTVSEKSTEPAGTQMTPSVSPLPSPDAPAPITPAPITPAPTMTALPSPSATDVAPPQVAVTAETKDATPVETATPAYPVYPPFDGPLWRRLFPRWFQGQQ
jgi:hypothetical protein